MICIHLYYAKEKVSYSIALDKIAKEDVSYKDDLNDALAYLDIYENIKVVNKIPDLDKWLDRYIENNKMIL